MSWGHDPYSVFIHELYDSFDNKFLPCNDNIWDKFGVSEGRHYISDIEFSTTDPDYIFSTDKYCFGSEDTGVQHSVKFTNMSGKNVVFSGPYKLLTDAVSTGKHQGIILTVTLKMSNVFNVIPGKVDWKNTPLTIDKLIEAMAAMHITYLKSNKCTGYGKCSMVLQYNIDLEYFLNKNPHRILYIESFGMKIGYKGCRLENNQEWVSSLKNKLDPDLWFDASSTSWQYAYVVDNTASIPPVWGMVAGKYIQVGKQFGLNRPDGLYIVTAEAFEDGGEHIFIPADQLEAGAAEQYGYGFQKESVNSGKSHREYSLLLDKYNKLIAELGESNEQAANLKSKNEALEKELKELKSEIDRLTKFRDEVEKLRAKDNVRDIELMQLKVQIDRAKQDAKIQVDKADERVEKFKEQNRDQADKFKEQLERARQEAKDQADRAKDQFERTKQEAKEQAEKAKQDIKDAKEEKVFRIIGVVLGFLGAVLGFFTGIKKLNT